MFAMAFYFIFIFGGTVAVIGGVLLILGTIYGRYSFEIDNFVNKLLK